METPSKPRSAPSAPKEREELVYHPLGGWVPKSFLEPVEISPRMKECARTGIYILSSKRRCYEPNKS